PEISVAMATFQGREFLQEQFESLLKQTRQPDEVIIYDDASSDDTVSLLKAFRCRAPFRVEIIEGTENAGVNHAFGTALAACRGTYIFFCDQDDLWESEKIGRFMAAFQSNRNIGLVFCDASQIDAEGLALPESLWQQIKFNKQRRRRFRRDPLGELLRGANFVYGMAAAFRAESIQPFCRINADPGGMTHDTWFALHVVAIGWQAVALEEKLVRYRRHGRQATKKESLSKSEGVRVCPAARRRQLLALIEGLQRVGINISAAPSLGAQPYKDKVVRQISSKVSHLLLRERLRDSRNPFLGCYAFVSAGYWKYARGPLSVFRDLFGL
ncbi:glycosyltransferase, partial [Planctomycetota bacterium]|nr:glycosyltransferase [Planctomycetota bacterium]